jgi:hypothetical protein
MPTHRRTVSLGKSKRSNRPFLYLARKTIRTLALAAMSGAKQTAPCPQCGSLEWWFDGETRWETLPIERVRRQDTPSIRFTERHMP